MPTNENNRSLDWFWTRAASSERATPKTAATRTAWDGVAQMVDYPRLSPQFCFNQTVLRDFLRLSRTAIDDSIIQNLNALETPGSKAFDARTTTSRQARPSGRLIEPAACDEFKTRVLFPSWQMRSDVVNYCAGVATAPDPDDPDVLQREVESARAHERVVDERLDPYSARYFPREARTESLAALLRNERMVENIVRARTWSILEERCGSSTQSWEQALDGWRLEHSKRT